MRRCLHHWVDHPDLDREIAIVRAQVPDAPEALARQVAALTARLREIGLYKPPGIAETIDWVQALVLLGAASVDVPVAEATLGAVLKYREDVDRVRAVGLDELLAVARDH